MPVTENNKAQLITYSRFNLDSKAVPTSKRLKTVILEGQNPHLGVLIRPFRLRNSRQEHDQGKNIQKTVITMKLINGS